MSRTGYALLAVLGCAWCALAAPATEILLRYNLQAGDESAFQWSASGTGTLTVAGFLSQPVEMTQQARHLVRCEASDPDGLRMVYGTDSAQVTASVGGVPLEVPPSEPTAFTLDIDHRGRVKQLGEVSGQEAAQLLAPVRLAAACLLIPYPEAAVAAGTSWVQEPVVVDPQAPVETNPAEQATSSLMEFVTYQGTDAAVIRTEFESPVNATFGPLGGRMKGTLKGVVNTTISLARGDAMHSEGSATLHLSTDTSEQEGGFLSALTSVELELTIQIRMDKMARDGTSEAPEGMPEKAQSRGVPARLPAHLTCESN